MFRYLPPKYGENLEHFYGRGAEAGKGEYQCKEAVIDKEGTIFQLGQDINGGGLLKKERD